MTRLAARLRARLSELGIRERLVLLVLAMLLPWVALFATTYASYTRDHNHDTRARLVELATQVGARVDDQLGTIEGLLLAIAEAASTDSSAAGRNDDMLRRLRMELPPYITGLALWNTDGRNIGTSDTDPRSARKLEVTAHRFFREALASTRLTVGRPIESREPRGWSLTIARRIRQGGAAAGVASVSARLDSLARFLTVGDSASSGTTITLIDDGGTVLARAGAGVAVGTRIVDPEAVKRMRDAGRGFVDSADVNFGEEFAYRRVSSAPWLLVVGKTADGSALTNEPEWRFLALFVGSSRVDLQACKLEYSIVSPK